MQMSFFSHTLTKHDTIISSCNHHKSKKGMIMKKHALSMYSLLSITLLFTTMLHTSEKKEETEKFEIIAVTVTDLQKPAAKPVGWFGSLYSQSWILSKPQLLLYAFEYNLFEKKNKEHKQLVNDALLVCVQQKDVTTLSKIATTLHEKFPTTTTLCTNKTARRIHDFITARQQADCISTNKELKTQRTQAASEINEHIKNIQSTIGLLIRMADMYESRQQGDFQNLCSNNKKHKSITLLLHQISGIDDAEDIITNCSDN